MQQRMTSQRRLSKTQRLRSPLDFVGVSKNNNNNKNINNNNNNNNNDDDDD